MKTSTGVCTAVLAGLVLAAFQPGDELQNTWQNRHPISSHLHEDGSVVAACITIAGRTDQVKIFPDGTVRVPADLQGRYYLNRNPDEGDWVARNGPRVVLGVETPSNQIGFRVIWRDESNNVGVDEYGRTGWDASETVLAVGYHEIMSSNAIAAGVALASRNMAANGGALVMRMGEGGRSSVSPTTLRL